MAIAYFKSRSLSVPIHSGFGRLPGIIISFCRKGDLNQDGQVNQLDVPLFIQLLLDPASVNQNNFCACDINGDGSINGLDIGPFTALLP